MNTNDKSNEKIKEALDLLKEASQEKKIELVDMMKGVYANVKDAEERAVKKAKKVAGDVDESVHKNPWPFIGGAAAAGMIIGFLLRRKSGR